MSSRLDRLFLLLETGSSPVTRKAAALQLGEVQKLHPHELHNLLAKVREYIHSFSWDTRIAAGQAVEAIINNVPQWEPSGTPCKAENSCTSPPGLMRFSHFNINRVIENGSSLLASEGKEYEMAVNDGKTEAETMARLANERLIHARNCGFFENLGMDAKDVISTEDLKIVETTDKNHAGGLDCKQSLSDMFPLSDGSSKAERLKTRRKSQALPKQKSKEAWESSAQTFPAGDGDDDPPKKLRRVTSVLVEQPSNDNAMLLDNVPDNSSLWEESTEWPLAWLWRKLGGDLFSSSWEVRHGSATALREVARLHGRGAGKRADTPASQLEQVNQLWLEDMSLRLLCVLALDRFGDFISDQVVAPVRETCAQALGAILRLMNEFNMESVLSVLLDLLQRPEWEARHGGLLAMKYLIAIKEEHLVKLMPVVFGPIFQGLQDSVDDVSAVAAAALVPITDILVKTLPEKVPEVVSVLWSMLLELDDLTASTSSILTLLASLLSYPSPVASSSLTTLVPRLWPFCSHASSSVRNSVLQALATLTRSTNPVKCEEWIPPLLPDILRLLFQRALVEHDEGIQEKLYTVWCQIVSRASGEEFLSHLLKASCPYLSGWLCLLMHPSRAPLDPALITVWFQAKHKTKEKPCFVPSAKVRLSHINRDGSSSSEQYCIGGSETHSESSLEWERSILRARFVTAQLLGLLSMYVTKAMPGVMYTSSMELPLDCFARLLLFHLNSRSALQRLAVALLLYHWAQAQKDNPCPLSVKEQCLSCLSDCVFYDEIALGFTRMQQESQDFLACLNHHNLPIDDSFRTSSVLSTSQIEALTSSVFESAIAKAKLRAKVLEVLQERRKSVQRILKQTTCSQATLNTQVQACLSSALVSLSYLPEKLNPVIRPLMESLKHEEVDILRDMSARSLVCLMEQCLERNPCPNVKIIKNLVGLVCGDPTFAPVISPELPVSLDEENGSSSGGGRQNNSASRRPSHVSTKFQGIIILQTVQKNAEKISLKRSNSTARKNCQGYEESGDSLSLKEVQQKILQRKGAACALKQMAEHFRETLPEKLPKLWEHIVTPLESYSLSPSTDDIHPNDNDEQAQELATNLLILEVTTSSLHASLHKKLVELLPALLYTLEHPYTVVRHLSARCLGIMSKVLTTQVMDLIVGPVLSNLGATHSLRKRQGAVEAITCVVEQLNLQVVPYIVLLVVPMLGRMSDQNEAVRLMATQTFATLIRLMPLESGIVEQPTLSAELLERKQQNRAFLEQLLDSKRAENYKVSVPIDADLRSYQQEGVNWLAFLNKYKLHGILCDDMGLGKTLQSLCILASDHYLRNKKYKETQTSDCLPLPSLVICPPTLTGHWVYEVEKFVSPSYLKPLHYTGPPSERTRLRSKAKKHNLIIASYDIVRNDIDFFSSLHWNYCILDEGHVIKNGKTKLSQAIKQLSANHRLILSGTPIQNNVLELWSLFDFLMPGFLGTEKQFLAKYSRPILLSRDAKSSSREQEAGVLALESLHRQVLPFVLRRMKEDVLKDLPPKIIQDYYCELSPLQVQLYEDFAKSKAHKTLEEGLDHAGSSENSSGNHAHVFQALQYLRKVCNHPKLVVNAQHPEYVRVSAQLKQQNTNLSDIQHAAKLSALKQLLLDCGIGVTNSLSSADPQPAVNQHRALIFCQLKSMLDILEKDLLRTHLPSVSYLRLDGSVPPGNRYSVVHSFNNDPSIDLLLLTTQVGGLGLNLTGADTVIFVEHDWNPMKDMQAMDRAHRIGQKKVVNVYRLITRGTLEEKIMGLQKFKMTVASTVISQENSSLLSMGTEQVLDLFLLDQTTNNNNNTKSTSGDSPKKKKGFRSVLENLPELWDSDQYESEYDLSNFMQMLNK